MRKDVVLTRKICRFEKRSRYYEKICRFTRKYGVLTRKDLVITRKYGVLRRKDLVLTRKDLVIDIIEWKKYYVWQYYVNVILHLKYSKIITFSMRTGQTKF